MNDNDSIVSQSPTKRVGNQVFASVPGPVVVVAADAGRKRAAMFPSASISLAARLLDIAGALVHEAAMSARPGQLDRLEAMAADLRQMADAGLPQAVIDIAWREYRYPRPALDEPTPGFERAMRVISEWIGGPDV